MRAEAGGPVLATLDRGALPVFGVLAAGVHVNGLVRRARTGCTFGSPAAPPARRSTPASSTTWWRAASPPA